MLGSEHLRPQWFAMMLQVSFVGGLTGEYVDFSTAQRAAFLMVAEREGIRVDAEDASAMVDRMSSLPAHTEVPGALAALRQTGLRVAALTNSPPAVAEAQLINAGLREYFHDVLSADQVRHLKPAPEPYHAVATAFGVEVSQVRLVAAHWWDVAGALAAGCRAAFVNRPGMVLSTTCPRPDIVEANIADVVARIIEVDADADG